MRIALVNTISPFIRGGAEILVDDLKHQLQIRGHDVILYRIPFPESFGLPLVRLVEACGMLRFDDFDRVIGFKFPAYCVEHRNRVVWMFHQFRQVYELWGTQYGIQDELQYEPLRDFIINTDERLTESRNVFVNAQEVGNRLMQYNGISSTVIMPPLENYEQYHCGITGDYIFYPSRVNSFKRQHLAVEAMCHVKTNVRLIIAGVCEDKGYNERLMNCIQQNHLENRVTYYNRWISDEEKRSLMSNCLGSMYLAYKEDSCGFVSMEAFYSAKPVISCTDSGGTKELVEDAVTGYFCEPNPESIATAMDQLFDNKEAAAQMGIAARRSILDKNINWDTTIRRLLA